MRLSLASFIVTIVMKFLAGTAAPLTFTELVWNVMSDVYVLLDGTSTIDGPEGWLGTSIIDGSEGGPGDIGTSTHEVYCNT